jgi:hypothetical protein
MESQKSGTDFKTLSDLSTAFTHFRATIIGIRNMMITLYRSQNDQDVFNTICTPLPFFQEFWEEQYNNVTLRPFYTQNCVKVVDEIIASYNQCLSDWKNRPVTGQEEGNCPEYLLKSLEQILDRSRKEFDTLRKAKKKR